MSGTVDMNREVPEQEVNALVTVEAMNRLMVKVHHLLDTDDLSEPDRYRALSLLESGVDLAAARYATNVKDLALSDRISARVREKVAKIVENTERAVAPLEDAVEPVEACGRPVMRWEGMGGPCVLPKGHAVHKEEND